MKPEANARALKARLDQQEEAVFSALACFSRDAVRRHEEPLSDTEYRLAFSADADRILNSMAYTRYSDKTQVFSLINNDHLTHRVLHVQMVSRVGRTIGRYLGLNTDLIEAASLGHDIGHPPFGHDGERFLSKLTRAENAGAFHHNLQSIQFLDRIEKKGKGWNLSLQTMDAILCHNGEAHTASLAPAPRKDFGDFNRMVAKMKTSSRADAVPMTLEGCVVRMADTISYIGRDLEDAIRLGLVTRDQMPGACKQLLGRTQGTIVFNLVTDLIRNSIDRDHIGFSSGVSRALKALKGFNYRHIYKNPAIKKHLMGIEDIFTFLFDTYMTDLARENRQSVIYSEFLDGMEPVYTDTHSPAEIVRDFIAGMTDSYFIRQAPDNLKPAAIDHV
ncbi:MAG: HD domain-containing protein [Desulfobacterales bacterium]|nr:HD domain-containing protein [Desulfobacterales bacterium]